MATTRRLFDRILAELRGSAGLDFERLLRSLGRGAESVLDALDPDTLAELMLDPDWRTRLKELAGEAGGRRGGTLDADEVKERLAEARRRREAHARAHREEARRKAEEEAARRRAGSSRRADGGSSAPPRGATDDPWRALGLERGATPAQIKAAYRRLAKAHHPDALGPGATDAARRESERRMRELNDAWARLKNLGK